MGQHARFVLRPRMGLVTTPGVAELICRFFCEQFKTADVLIVRLSRLEDKEREGSVVIETTLCYAGPLYLGGPKEKLRKMGDWLVQNYIETFEVLYGRDTGPAAPYNKADLL